jgi:hypothetical protein
VASVIGRADTIAICADNRVDARSPRAATFAKYVMAITDTDCITAMHTR